MQVIVSTIGKFHHFDLARQLYQRGLLRKLFTAYPIRYVDELPWDFVITHPHFLYIEKFFRKIGLYDIAERISPLTNQDFDRFVGRNLMEADIFLCNNGSGLYSYQRARELGAKIVCDCGQPHISMVYNLISNVYQNFGKKFWYSKSLYERKIIEYEEADQIIIPSRYSAQTFIDMGIDRAKLVTIPYGVDLGLFHQSPKEDDVFRVMFVGRVEILKGIPYLLDALGDIKSPGFELQLVGPVMNEVKELIEKCDGNINVVGAVPKTKLSWYYSQASVLVVPSLLEGLALVIPEAMACGVPVIATKNSGVEEIITDGVEGFVIPAQNSSIIRDRVLQLIEDPTIQQDMSRAALERVKSVGGWESYGALISETFSELIQ